jgi:hypothetical protein
MNYSKIHQTLRENYLTEEINDYPEQYLGPNYETVLNYWLYLESLPEITKINYIENSATKPYGFNSFIVKEATLLTPYQVQAWYTTQISLNSGEWYGWATVELICMHRILDEGKSLFYLPKIFNECQS